MLSFELKFKLQLAQQLITATSILHIIPVIIRKEQKLNNLLKQNLKMLMRKIINQSQRRTFFNTSFFFWQIFVNLICKVSIPSK